jgi:hypothetical protein
MSSFPSARFNPKEVTPQMIKVQAKTVRNCPIDNSSMRSGEFRGSFRISQGNEEAWVKKIAAVRIMKNERLGMYIIMNLFLVVG